MTAIQHFFNLHKPKSTPQVFDLALDHTPEGQGVVYDLCCGSGVLTAKIALVGYQAYGIDISTEFIGSSGKLANGFVVADIAAPLPLRTASAKIVYCIDSLQYFAQPGDVLSEISRVLEVGGIIIFSTQNNYNWVGIKRYLIERLTGRTWSPWLAHPVENHMTYPWLMRALKENGFEPEYVRGLQFLGTWINLLPRGIRTWSPWADKPWRSLNSIAQRTRLPAILEESFLGRFAMIIFVRARKIA
jgi:SAM-dependent methyltransferase